MFPQLLIDFELFLEMQRVVDLKEEGNGDGGGFTVLLKRLVLVETIIPVIDLLV